MASLKPYILGDFFFILHALSLHPRIFYTLCLFFLLCTSYIFIWKYSLWFSFPLNRQLFTLLKLAFLTVKIGVKVTCLSLVILMNISYNKEQAAFSEQPAKKQLGFEDETDKTKMKS